MDFITGLPHLVRRHDLIWVIMDRLTKSAHFFPVQMIDLAPEYAKLLFEKSFDFMGPSVYHFRSWCPFYSKFLEILSERIGYQSEP